MTLKQVMAQMLEKALDSTINIYMRDVYTIMASRINKMVVEKGPEFPASQLTVQEISKIKTINVRGLTCQIL
jgi:hypothetical protein